MCVNCLPIAIMDIIRQNIAFRKGIAYRRFRGASLVYPDLRRFRICNIIKVNE